MKLHVTMALYLYWDIHELADICGHIRRLKYNTVTSQPDFTKG